MTGRTYLLRGEQVELICKFVLPSKRNPLPAAPAWLRWVTPPPGGAPQRSHPLPRRPRRGAPVPRTPENPMTYRILITGSRTWSDEGTIWDALNDAIDEQAKNGEHEFVIVHGHCPRGADAIADFYCEDQAGWRDNAGQQLAVERHPADWKRNGRHAGPLRNQRMVDAGADLCLAFIRGNSRGATDCARRARTAGIPVKEWRA